VKANLPRWLLQEGGYSHACPNEEGASASAWRGADGHSSAVAVVIDFDGTAVGTVQCEQEPENDDGLLERQAFAKAHWCKER
jgi:hypothetical protein